MIDSSEPTFFLPRMLSVTANIMMFLGLSIDRLRCVAHAKRKVKPLGWFAPLWVAAGLAFAVYCGTVLAINVPKDDAVACVVSSSDQS